MPVTVLQSRLSERAMRYQRKHPPGADGLIYTFLFLAGVLLVGCGEKQPPASAEPSSPPPVTVEKTEPAANPAPGIDPVSGLVIDEGWELVLGHCAACHSASLVTQNRGSRETWKDMIVWMQETQGLWPLDPQTEATILDYLARNYPPSASSRRAPLPPEQMPANPYENTDPS